MNRILVVEDNAMNLELVLQLLEDDYELLTAEDGEEGVAQARAHKPDLILMDLLLPKLTGWDATAQIRKIDELKKVPIIALTAHAVQSELDRAMEAGCNAYVTKPLDEDLLLETIGKYLGAP